MLRAKLEIIPYGELDKAKTIATIYIANLGTNKLNIADYGIVIEHENGFFDCKVLKGWQRGHSVKEGGGALNLLKTCLNCEAERFNPSLVAIIKDWKEENGID